MARNIRAQDVRNLSEQNDRLQVQNTRLARELEITRGIMTEDQLCQVEQRIAAEASLVTA